MLGHVLLCHLPVLPEPLNARVRASPGCRDVPAGSDYTAAWL